MELTEQITAEAEAILSENEHHMDAAESETAEHEAEAGPETDEAADPGDDEPEEEEAEEGSSENPDEA